MSKYSINKTQFKIDFSFQGLPQTFMHQFISEPSNFLLTESEPWECAIQNWLHFMRDHNSFSCPQVVREAELLSLGLVFTDDETIQSLNASWRNKSQPTDVLSFPMIDETSSLSHLGCVEIGDIVVSAPKAKSQSIQNNHEFGMELRWLVSHGLLHLLGWVHPDETSLDQMLRCQEQLLAISGNVKSRSIEQSKEI